MKRLFGLEGSPAMPMPCAPKPSLSVRKTFRAPSGPLFAASLCRAAAPGLFDSSDCGCPPDRDATVVFDTEEYKTVGERPFAATTTNPLSTFGVDVDTAMYANLRRMILEEDRLPAAEAVRIEELINYFSYDYPQPEKESVMRP
ncbi:MAG: von Willebrand factor type A domain-containing protein, partial [Lentisphaeria bacterium]|nr:von Willebrand factor type A domain-containing protein [Lentisphaeria bacterium]